jgi:two-component system, NtrC family, response regulator AtoC
MPNLLVVDDDVMMLRYLRTVLECEHYQVATAASGAEALQELRRRPLPDLVLMDLVMPDMDGLETLARLREIAPSVKVIMLSGSKEAREVVQAMKLGAYDYLCKPVGQAELVATLKNCLDVSPAIAENPEVLEELSSDSFFLAASPAMHKAHDQIRRIAEVDVPVFITGESGTGKEIASLLLHKLSSRSQKKFLKVNCAAIPEELLESELFGYEAGAFTGATHSKPGLFELGDRGTILLDEIAEMPPRLQAKLLQVLQEQKFFRLGSKSPVTVNIRILAATNVDIEDAIKQGKLRLDLYYRLNAFNVCLPPLRERREEIAPLFRHYMKRLAYSYKLPPRILTDGLLRACMQHAWPGNLRELHNFVKRYLVLGDDVAMTAELLTQSGSLDRINLVRTQGASASDLKKMVREIKGEAEAEAIAQALEQTNWNRKQAASLLNISYKALTYKSRQYGILRTQPSPRKLAAMGPAPLEPARLSGGQTLS